MVGLQTVPQRRDFSQLQFPQRPEMTLQIPQSRKHMSSKVVQQDKRSSDGPSIQESVYAYQLANFQASALKHMKGLNNPKISMGSSSMGLYQDGLPQGAINGRQTSFKQRPTPNLSPFSYPSRKRFPYQLQKKPETPQQRLSRRDFIQPPTSDSNEATNPIGMLSSELDRQSHSDGSVSRDGSQQRGGQDSLQITIQSLDTSGLVAQVSDPKQRTRAPLKVESTKSLFYANNQRRTSNQHNFLGSLISTPTPFNLTRPINPNKMQKSSSGGAHSGLNNQGMQSSDSQTCNTPGMGSVRGTPSHFTQNMPKIAKQGGHLTQQQFLMQNNTKTMNSSNPNIYSGAMDPQRRKIKKLEKQLTNTKIFLNMVIHDMRNPTNSIDYAIKEVMKIINSHPITNTQNELMQRSFNMPQVEYMNSTNNRGHFLSNNMINQNIDPTQPQSKQHLNIIQNGVKFPFGVQSPIQLQTATPTLRNNMLDQVSERLHEDEEEHLHIESIESSGSEAGDEHLSGYKPQASYTRLQRQSQQQKNSQNQSIVISAIKFDDKKDEDLGVLMIESSNIMESMFFDELPQERGIDSEREHTVLESCTKHSSAFNERRVVQWKFLDNPDCQSPQNIKSTNGQDNVLIMPNQMNFESIDNLMNTQGNIKRDSSLTKNEMLNQRQVATQGLRYTSHVQNSRDEFQEEQKTDKHDRSHIGVVSLVTPKLSGNSQFNSSNQHRNQIRSGKNSENLGHYKGANESSKHYESEESKREVYKNIVRRVSSSRDESRFSQQTQGAHMNRNYLVVPNRSQNVMVPHPSQGENFLIRNDLLQQPQKSNQVQFGTHNAITGLTSVQSQDRHSSILSTNEMRRMSGLPLMNQISRLIPKGMVLSQEEKKQCESLLKNSLFSSTMLLNLINDLLDLAKIENSQFNLNTTIFNLHDVIQKALDTLEFQAQQKTIIMSYDFDESKVGYFMSMEGDDNRYLQILLNFLSNALKFTPANGTIKVETRLVDSQDKSNKGSAKAVDSNLKKQLRQGKTIIFGESKHPSFKVRQSRSTKDLNMAIQSAIRGSKEHQGSSVNPLQSQRRQNEELKKDVKNLIDKTSEKYIKFEIRIIDSGYGISKENIGKLFMNFGKLEEHAEGNKRGTGLGLSICKSLIELMGGSVTVESEIGQGTQFIMSLSTKCNYPSEIKIQEWLQKHKNIEPNEVQEHFEEVVALHTHHQSPISTQNVYVNLQPIPNNRPKFSSPGLLTVQRNASNNFVIPLYKNSNRLVQGQNNQPNKNFLQVPANRNQEARKLPSIYLEPEEEDIVQRSNNNLTFLPDHMSPAHNNQKLVFGSPQQLMMPQNYLFSDFNQANQARRLTSDQNIQLFFSGMQQQYFPGYGETDEIVLNIQKPYRALVANDDSFQLQIISMLLRNCGFEVDEAENGMVAVQKYQKSRSGQEEAYDVVILDLDMPIMNGYEACSKIRKGNTRETIQQLVFIGSLRKTQMLQQSNNEPFEASEVQRQQRHNQRLYIIALSGLITQSVIDQGTRCGFDEFIETPLNENKVKEIIIQRLQNQNQYMLENYSDDEEENECDFYQQQLSRNVIVNPNRRLSSLGIQYNKPKDVMHATAFSAVDEEQSSIQEDGVSNDPLRQTNQFSNHQSSYKMLNQDRPMISNMLNVNSINSSFNVQQRHR